MNTPKQRFVLSLGFAFVAAAATLLRLVPPERSAFYPPCPFHTVTGFLCPGCGTTRALAALTHGHLQAALHLNALAVLLLPVLALYAFYRIVTPNPARLPNTAVYTLLLVTAAFTIARNVL